MRTYDELIADLRDPIQMSPEVFVADDYISQPVCDFILALALVFNDFKDLMAAQQLMQCVAPPDGPPDASRGMFGGLHIHWVRLLAGVIHELTELIGKNKQQMDSVAFQRLIGKLPKAGREMWTNVVASSIAAGPQGDHFGRLLFYTRMKVGFHYDAKEIARGYRERFLSERDNPPYISHGKTMAATRFYFADAAVEKYMMGKAGAATAKEFFTVGWALLPEIGHALREIVTQFVKLRERQRRKH